MLNRWSRLMMNQEHFEILNQGVKVWNEWRIANPEVIPDLSSLSYVYGVIGGVLSIGGGENYRGFNFSNTNFTNSSFSNVNLEEANLSGANLENAKFGRGSFRQANLKAAILKKSDFQEADFSEANLSQADLRETDLEKAKFSKANLVRADLREAKLRGVDFSDANLNLADLSNADLFRAILFKANLSQAILFKTDLHSAVLWGANLRNAKLRSAKLWGADLREADIREADLSDADLGDADIRSADLSNANLERTLLVNTRALATNFAGSTFTEACIENWHINSETNFSCVICDRVYLRYPLQECRPHNGEFDPGDFTKLVQDSLDTVDLIFKKGVNWKAFTYSFYNTQVENEGSLLGIRSIENKGDGVVLIRVAIPPHADKSKIHNDFKEGYDFAQKVLEPQYQARIEDKNKEIDRLFFLVSQSQNKLGEAQKLMAEKSGIQQNFFGNPGSVAGNVEGDQKTIQHNYAPEQKQTLAAATEIQQLLKQIEKTYSTATAAEKQSALAIEIQQEIKRNPTFKARLRNALKEGGIEALKVLFAPIGIPIEMVRGWIEAEAEYLDW